MSTPSNTQNLSSNSKCGTLMLPVEWSVSEEVLTSVLVSDASQSYNQCSSCGCHFTATHCTNTGCSSTTEYPPCTTDGSASTTASAARSDTQATTGNASIPGPRGLQGLQGAQGSRGASGNQGLAGKNGKDGKNGDAGKNGDVGKRGKDGIDGAPGVDGADGIDGKHGIHGKHGDDGKDGKDGANGIDAKDGADGKDGKHGIDGAIGPASCGDRGIQGVTGMQGLQGPQGLTGIDGPQGVQGPEGTCSCIKDPVVPAIVRKTQLIHCSVNKPVRVPSTIECVAVDWDAKPHVCRDLIIELPPACEVTDGYQVRVKVLCNHNVSVSCKGFYKRNESSIVTPGQTRTYTYFAGFGWITTQ